MLTIVVVALALGGLGILGMQEWKRGAELTMFGILAPWMLLAALGLLFLVFIVPNA